MPDSLRPPFRARSRRRRFSDRRREQLEGFEYHPIGLAASAHWRLVPRLIRRAHDVVPQRARSVVQRYGLRNRQFEFDLPITAVHTFITRSPFFVLRCKSLPTSPDYESQSSQNLSVFGPVYIRSDREVASGIHVSAICKT